MEDTGRGGVVERGRGGAAVLEDEREAGGRRRGAERSEWCKEGQRRSFGSSRESQDPEWRRWRMREKRVMGWRRGKEKTRWWAGLSDGLD